MTLNKVTLNSLIRDDLKLNNGKPGMIIASIETLGQK